MGRFLAAENPLTVMQNAIYFTLKALFVIKIFKNFPLLFVHVEKRLNLKAKVSYKIYDVTNWIISNYNTHKIYDVTNWIISNYKTHIAQYLKTPRQLDKELEIRQWQLEIFFLINRTK